MPPNPTAPSPGPCAFEDRSGLCRTPTLTVEARMTPFLIAVTQRAAMLLLVFAAFVACATPSSASAAGRKPADAAARPALVAQLPAARGAGVQAATQPPRRRGAPEVPARRYAELAGGRLLIATRQLTGPFFAQSVVLLLDYDSDGAVGLVLNHPTNVPLPELLPEVSKLGDRRDPVFLGGPVDARRMVFLVRADAPPADSRHVVADVHATGSAEVLRGVIENDTPADRFRAYVGYAGWASGQLDAEVARGDWYIEEAAPSVIFDDSVGDLWRRLVAGHEGVHVRLRTGPPRGATD